MEHISDYADLPDGLQLLRLCANYARALLSERIDPGDATRAKDSIPFELRVELDKTVETVLAAWENRVAVPYHIKEVEEIFQTQAPNSRDNNLRKICLRAFGNTEVSPPILVSEPTLYVDSSGCVIAWYLPHVFTRRRRDLVYKAVRDLSIQPKTVLSFKKSSANWRENACDYKDSEGCVLQPGNVSMSVCWYQQGHASHNSTPGPSASLKENPQTGAISFLADMRETNAVFGALLALVHPKLFEQQFSVHVKTYMDRERLTSHPGRVGRLFCDWSSPFTAFALISNRLTRLHRDVKGGKHLLDLVSVFGEYTGGRFEISLLNARFAYNAGTALMFPGYLMEHGASEVSGERVCIASYFRPNVGYGVLPTSYQEVPLATMKQLKAFGFPLGSHCEEGNEDNAAEAEEDNAAEAEEDNQDAGCEK